MYYNEKRKAITAKYVKTHLDDIKIRVPKGQREKLKAIAAEMGMSMNQMFIKAVEEYIERNYKPEEANETDYWLELLFRTGYLPDQQFRQLRAQCAELRVLLIASCRTAKQKPHS